MEVEVVPGPPEEEMLARAQALASLADLIDVVPPLADHEFGQSDFESWYKILPAKAKRELSRLVSDGTLACAERIDPRTGRRMKGYWRL